eukprot:CAMPEP_0115073334 /NCGR_PEP_ID=MMETSP0227-20121206/14727_1 /TAXON_ID=89957 /ORGANISM="Polarella glacialis, Strain CCMP 1383" /LENGTH=52 /DNA_ID=CAMNT_0002460179 /DNA_START=33 /DNA_END=188 /DNA_ORIENTATION=-
MAHCEELVAGGVKLTSFHCCKLKRQAPGGVGHCGEHAVRNGGTQLAASLAVE